MLQRDYVGMLVLRDKLKDLAVLQIKVKRARKTTLPKAEWEALKKDILDSVSYQYNRDRWDQSFAASEVYMRKAEITACLNLYHELRGSEHRHAGKGYWYEKALETLRAELKKIPS